MKYVIVVALLTTGCATTKARDSGAPGSVDRIVKVCAYNALSSLMMSGQGFLSLAGMCDENEHTKGVEL